MVPSLSLPLARAAVVRRSLPPPCFLADTAHPTAVAASAGRFGAVGLLLDRGVDTTIRNTESVRLE